MKFKNYIDNIFGFGDNTYCTVYDKYATGDISINHLSIHIKKCLWCRSHINSDNGIVVGCNCFACELLNYEINGKINDLRYEAASMIKKYFYAAQKRNSLDEEVEDYRKRVLSITKKYMNASGKEKNECLGEILNQALSS